jgi:hypothetical protein
MERTYTRHDALLREAVTAQRGRVDKIICDAFQIVFPLALEAVAAVAAQQAQVAEDWSPVGLPEPLKVRMAPHAGAVEPDPDGDYQSRVLNGSDGCSGPLMVGRSSGLRRRRSSLELRSHLTSFLQTLALIAAKICSSPSTSASLRTLGWPTLSHR